METQDLFHGSNKKQCIINWRVVTAKLVSKQNYKSSGRHGVDDSKTIKVLVCRDLAVKLVEQGVESPATVTEVRYSVPYQLYI